MRKLIIGILATLAVFAGGAAFGVGTTRIVVNAPVIKVTGTQVTGFREYHSNGIVVVMPPLAAALRKCKYEASHLFTTSSWTRSIRLHECQAGTHTAYHKEVVLRDSLRYAYKQ